MAPRKRVGRLKGRATTQALSSTQAVSTCGFPALADEIYLEIMSYIPTVPIPSTTDSCLLYPELRRSRHETLLSLSQTSRSLRRFFWRYLWQRIEVCEGMKIGDEDAPYLPSINRCIKTHKRYNAELVRQLEIVTVRNPQLAQYVNYLDVFIADYSFDTVIAELARCLSLFPNLHTVQIKVASVSKRSLHKIFARTFKDYSYPQIRDVSVMLLSQSFIASCPEARHVNFIKKWTWPPPDTDPRAYLDLIINNCPRLEVLDDFPENLDTVDGCKRVVNSFPNLRTIILTPSGLVGNQIDILSELNYLQTFILCWRSTHLNDLPGFWFLSPEERGPYYEGKKKDWIEVLKHVLIQVGHRDNLEKTLIIRGLQNETKILIKPIPKGL